MPWRSSRRRPTMSRRRCIHSEARRSFARTNRRAPCAGASDLDTPTICTSVERSLAEGVRHAHADFGFFATCERRSRTSRTRSASAGSSRAVTGSPPSTPTSTSTRRLLPLALAREPRVDRCPHRPPSSRASRRTPQPGRPPDGRRTVPSIRRFNRTGTRTNVRGARVSGANSSVLHRPRDRRDERSTFFVGHAVEMGLVRATYGHPPLQGAPHAICPARLRNRSRREGAG